MVQWEEHPSHLATRLGQLLEHQTLVDVTLMCNTHTLRVHRAVLAACSPYFETILQRQLGMYPLIVLKDMQFSVLKSLIEFMYCGETSVTEDNLSALLQAAKFFQVKGLSAMTKEALGLTSQTPKTTTVNGDSARKAFVGRSKRVGMQQTFVASGLKTLSSTTHAATSHAHGLGGDMHTTTAGKTVFQTTPKSVPVRQETHHHQQQQQQTDTAQLLLSLSGSEFPKQTFHTVSKNVRFHHGVSSGGAVTVEPSRSCPLDSSVVKNKETAVRSEVIDRVPVVTQNAGVKPASVALPTHAAGKGIEQPAAPEKVVETAKDDVTPQMIFVEDSPCKRGRPLKRQMNLVFQEKVLTDADLALRKEAEASRKALEMLRQEMATGDETPGTECAQQKVVPVKQPLSKGQMSQSVNNILATASRILPKEPVTSTKLGVAKTNTVTQVTSVNTPETSNQNIIYQVAGNAIPAIDSGSNETNIVYQLQEGVIAGQDSSGATNVVYQVADNAVVTGQDANSQNIIYQVADGAVTSAEGSNNTNIIYQVADNSNAGSGSAMSQYMEVLKEAGLPSDVPILLESSDGSYVTVNEEVLMNIMNGGMIQVGDGSIVGGEGVQFIVQEVQEVTEGQLETPVASAEQLASAEMNVTDSVPAGEQQQMNEASDSMVESKPVVMETDTNMGESSTHTPLKEQVTEFCDKAEAEGLTSLERNKAMNMELATSQSENIAAVACGRKPVQYDVKQLEGSGVTTESTPMVVDDGEVMPTTEPPTHSDEVITGDGYGEEAMEGFAVMETKGNMQRKQVHCTGSDTADFTFREQACSSEVEDKSLPASECEMDSEIPANGGMSVEQALQAMMGEGSDTEMEVSANAAADSTTKVRAVISHHDNKGHGTQNEGFVDEETEDLRLVLSPEDDSIKPEDESQSAGERSFTLALSSPDSIETEKTLLEAENVAGSAEGSQQFENKSLESENDTQTKVSQDATTEIKYPSDSTLTSVPSSADSVGADTLPNEAVNMGTSDNFNSVEINGSEADEPVVQAVANETGTITAEINNSGPLESNTDIFSETGSPATASGVVVDHTAEGRSESSNILTDKPGAASGTTEVLTYELNSAYTAVTTDEITGNVHSKDFLAESDHLSDIAFSSSVCSVTSTEVALAGTEAAVCSPKSNIVYDCNNTENSVNVASIDGSVVDKSLPVVSVTDSNTGIKGEEIVGKADSVNEVGGSGMSAGPSEADVLQTETNSLNQLICSSRSAALTEAVVPETETDPGNQLLGSSRNAALAGTDVLETATDSVNQLVCSSRSTALTGADVLETEFKNDVDTELPAAAILESFAASTIQQGVTGNVLADDKKAQDTEISKEAVEMGLNSDKEMEGNETVAVLHCEPGRGDKSEEEGKVESGSSDVMDTMLVENQEGREITSQVISTVEGALQTSVETCEGAVSSPSKDIPYAVGLLPLRTALEKLQAMPEYHPRKTRSASSGKESGGEVPAGRLKRKASSSADSLEKKMKPCDANDDDDDHDDDDDGGVYDTEGAVAMSVKEFDGNAILDTSVVEDNKAILKSPSPEESMETVAVDNKMEPLPSVMELVSDTSDAV